jgi:hypothetical protein
LFLTSILKVASLTSVLPVIHPSLSDVRLDRPHNEQPKTNGESIGRHCLVPSQSDIDLITSVHLDTNQKFDHFVDPSVKVLSWYNMVSSAYIYLLYLRLTCA